MNWFERNREMCWSITIMLIISILICHYCASMLIGVVANWQQQCNIGNQTACNLISNSSYANVIVYDNLR